MADTATMPDCVGLDVGDDVTHYFCWCDPDTALCGWDISGEEVVAPVADDDDCPLCVLLLDSPCGKCNGRVS